VTPGFWRQKSAERWQLALAYLLIVIAMAVSLYWLHDLVDDAHSDANRALVQQQIRAEQVCSATNQGDACRELFDRLARSITPEQRYRLGCNTLAGLLPNRDAARMRRLSHCPPPPR
jgi:hypothetical protein